MNIYDPLDALDPLARINARLNRVLGGSSRAPMYPELPEEEAQSLMDSLLNKSVGALQYVGETLDKPGRAVRGLLAGRPGELLNLLPFSDTLGLTDPETGTSGRDLLDQYGITPQNQEGFHPFDNPMDAVGDVAGFAAEVALDPMTYLTFGASALGKGGQALKKSGVLTDDVIKAGVRGRVQNTVGDVLGRLDDVRRADAESALRDVYGGVDLSREAIKRRDAISKTDDLLHRLNVNITDKKWGYDDIGFRLDANIKDGSVSLGSLLGDIVPAMGDRPAAMRITSAGVDDAMRGRGIGVAMYQSLAEEAAKRKMNLRSDVEVTMDAARAYEGLARRGYEVVRNPAARLEVIDGVEKLVTPRGKGPVFEVRTAGGNAAATAAKDAAKRLGVALDEKIGGHVGVGLPFMEPMAVFGTSADGLSGRAANMVGGLGDVIRRSPPGAFVRSLLGRSVLGATDPIAQDSFAPRLDRVRRATLDENRWVQETANAVPELANKDFQTAAKAYHTLGDEAPEILRDMGVPEMPNLSDAAKRAIDDSAARGSSLHTDTLKMGFVDVGKVEDEYMKRYRYRPGNLAEYPTADKADVLRGGGRRFQMKYDATRGREKALSDIPGGEVAIDMLSKDARFVGADRLKGRDATNEILVQLFGYARGDGGGFVKSLKDVERAMRTAAAKSTAYKPRWIWQKEVAEVAKETGWNAKALERAVRDAAVLSTNEAKNYNEIWDVLDDSLRQPRQQNTRLANLRAAIIDPQVDQTALDATFKFREWVTGAIAKVPKLPKSLRESPTKLREFIAAGRDAASDKLKPVWDSLDKLLKDKKGPRPHSELRKAILKAEDEASAVLRNHGYDQWKEQMLSTGLLQPELFDDFDMLKDFIRSGRKRVTRREGWTKPTREMIEEVARDDVLREQMEALGKQAIDPNEKAAIKEMLKDRKKAAALAKKLGSLDPRHVTEKQGLYERAYLPTEAAYRTQMTAAREMSAGVHDMLAEMAVIPGAQQTITDDLVPMREAIAAIVKSNTASAKAAERMLADALKFQNDKIAAKFAGANVEQAYVPLKAVKEAQKVLKNWRTPEEIGNIGRIVDKFTDWFKVGVTAFPTFHTRNLASGQIQNVLNGLVSATDLFPLANMARKVVIGKDAIKGLSEIKVFKGMSDKEATKALKEMITAYDVWGDKFQGNIPELMTETPKLFPKGGMEPLEEMMMPRHSVSALGEIVGTAKDIKAAGLKNFIPKSPEFIGKRLYKTHGEVGRYVEGLNRVSGFIGALKKGLSPAEAAARVKFTQVDYANMTAFERTFLKRAFPFWSFSRGIAENVAKTLFERPGGAMAQSIRASNEARDTAEFLPDYIGESATIPTGTPGQYITSLGLAHEAPFEWFAATPTLQGTVKRFGQKMLSQASPYIKAPLEMATGINLFTGRPQEELYQYPFSGETGVGRMANSVLANSPIARWLTTTRKLADDRKNLPIKALGLTTGLSIADVSDPERVKEFASRRLLEEVLKQSPRIRSREDVYMPADKRAEATEEEKRLLRLLKGNLARKQREAAKKRKEAQKAAEQAAR